MAASPAGSLTSTGQADVDIGNVQGCSSTSPIAEVKFGRRDDIKNLQVI